MAEKTNYPQIPSTVWWGVRSLFHRSPNAKVDEHFLSADLGVQEAAARQYVGELRRIGLLNDEGKATALAAKWRLDDTYAEAVSEILDSKYPAGLRQLSAAGQIDRQKVVAWFMSHGLGNGAAKNKASTYLLIASPISREAPSNAEEPDSSKKSSGRARPKKAVAPTVATRIESAANTRNGETRGADGPSLNVNVQIHISADASSDQIEHIFSAMKRYLYEGS